MSRHFTLLSLFSALAGIAQPVETLNACPFCSAVSQTFTEEMESMDAVVIGRLVHASAVPASVTDSDAIPQGTFEIVKCIKGQQWLEDTNTVTTVYFGGASVGDNFVIMGADPPKIAWSTPLKVSERAIEYLSSLQTLPRKGGDRLRFFQQYLEDDDKLLAADAYDEFARAPFSEIQELAPHVQREQVLAWIRDTEIPASRRRLYLVMLSVCGRPEDAALLEMMMKSDNRRDKAGLDAMIGCYLTMTGASGMPLVERLFLGNETAEYADTYAAIMALRFHGTETDFVPRERILQGLHLVLARPQLADLVIPDLARWEDWSQIERLCDLFREADDNSSWVRVPIINYLRACPKPEAKRELKTLEELDPDAVKRANSFFPFASGSSAEQEASEPKETSGATDNKASQPASDETSSARLIGQSPQVASADASATLFGWVGRDWKTTSHSRFHLLGMASLVGAIIMLLQWGILSSAGKRY